MIIDKLGTPSEEDTAFISDPGAQSYLNNLPKSSKKNFKDMYPFPDDGGQSKGFHINFPSLIL